MNAGFECGRPPFHLDAIGGRYIPLSPRVREVFDLRHLEDGSDPAYADGFLEKIGIPSRVWQDGVIECPDSLLVEPRCAIIPLSINEPLVGSSLNWAPGMIKIGSIPANIGLVDPSVRLAEAILLHAPGFQVFGHWLLDFVPRLLTIRELIKQTGTKAPIVCRRIPRWGRQFIEATGLSDRIQQLRDDAIVHVNRLYIPLIRKSGVLYSTDMLRESFTYLDETMGRGTDTAKPERVMIARSKPPHAVNQDLAIAEALDAGFAILRPEIIPFPEQIAIFRNAKEIRGEDGSALHNIGFCRANPAITMYTRGSRSNYWHLSVAKAAAVKLRAIRSEERQGGYFIPVQS